MASRKVVERPRVPSTCASRALRRALVAGIEGMTTAQVAAKLGRSQQSLSAYAHGTRRPDEWTRGLIELVLGIPADDWMTAAERKERERLQRAASRDSAA